MVPRDSRPCFRFDKESHFSMTSKLVSIEVQVDNFLKELMEVTVSI